MVEGKLVETRCYAPDRTRGTIKSVDEVLARQMPALALPTMADAARKAFRAVLEYEAWPSNNNYNNILQLIEARGFSAHPCDWIPEFDWRYAGKHPSLYQPWADWLSENGITRFHSGNTLTPENCHLWSGNQRRQAFSLPRGLDDEAGVDLLKRIAQVAPANVRASLVGEIRAGGLFNGVYPRQVPILQHFLNDPAASVRNTAQNQLDAGDGWKSEQFYIDFLIDKMNVTPSRISFQQPVPEGSGYMVPFHCITFDALAHSIGITPVELAERADIDSLGVDFMSMATGTGAIEAREVLARRMLDNGVKGEEISHRLFRGFSKALWRRGLEAQFSSTYIFSVRDYLGDQAGTLTLEDMRRWDAYKFMPNSVAAEVDNGRLPMNVSWDPVRILGMTVDKKAAQIALDEAISLGMEPDNPRLSMLKLNLAL